MNPIQTKYFFPYNEFPPNFYKSSLINDAIHNLGQVVKTPSEMNFSVVLAAASTALQGLIDVELPSGKVCPISLNILCIAGSGERKSSLEDQVFSGIKKFIADDNERLKREKLKYKLLINEFKKNEKKLTKTLENAPDTEKDELIETIINHQLSKPEAPKPRLMKLEDVTYQAMQKEMSGSNANVLLSSSEGGKILNSPLTQNTSFLNDTWSGQSSTITRKSLESVTIEDPRLTVCIMTQPSTIDVFTKKTKDDVRDNGFWSRFLISNPRSTCGTRFERGINPSKEGIINFNNRVYDLLQALHSHKKIALKFSYESKLILQDIYNDIEAQMSQGGYFEHAKDHASKLIENIARVAAILHAFENLLDGQVSQIPEESVWDAIDIVSFYSSEFMKIFCAPPKFVTDANKLDNWFYLQSYNGKRYIRKNHILQFGPNEVRTKKDLDAALDYLMTYKQISIITVNRFKVIDLLPFEQHNTNQMQHDLMVNSIKNISH